MSCEAWELQKGVERCPTCGKFTSLDFGYGDLEPGAVEGIGYQTVYCNSDCAERKDPPGIYEGTPEMAARDRAIMEKRDAS